MESKDALPAEEAVIPLDPMIALLHERHTFTSPFSTSAEKAQAKSKIIAEIQEHAMRPFWSAFSELLGWAPTEGQLAEWDAINAAKEKKIDEEIKDAQEHFGATEVRDATLKKCDLFARIGDFENCLKYNEECGAMSIAVGPKLDLAFQRIRLGIAFSDNDTAAKAITDAHRLLKDGDWERRNRLKVYEGVYYLCVRNFAKGAQMLLDSLSTFASTELVDFKQFVWLTLCSALVTLDRAELKKKMVESPEALSASVGAAMDLVQAVYQCRYKEVFPVLSKVCFEMRRSVFLSSHVNYFFREVRVLVLNQFLESYSSVTLSSLATAFGIPVSVMDSMLCTLISNERIACKIDRVSGNVTTYRGDAINFQYHKIVKNGDILLNRIQKLSRVIEM